MDQKATHLSWGAAEAAGESCSPPLPSHAGPTALGTHTWAHITEDMVWGSHGHNTYRGSHYWGHGMRVTWSQYIQGLTLLRTWYEDHMVTIHTGAHITEDMVWGSHGHNTYSGSHYWGHGMRVTWSQYILGLTFLRTWYEDHMVTIHTGAHITEDMVWGSHGHNTYRGSHYWGHGMRITWSQYKSSHYWGHGMRITWSQYKSSHYWGHGMRITWSQYIQRLTLLRTWYEGHKVTIQELTLLRIWYEGHMVTIQGITELKCIVWEWYRYNTGAHITEEWVNHWDLNAYYREPLGFLADGFQEWRPTNFKRLLQHWNPNACLNQSHYSDTDLTWREWGGQGGHKTRDLQTSRQDTLLWPELYIIWSRPTLITIWFDTSGWFMGKVWNWRSSTT